jgi:hypothetical protein
MRKVTNETLLLKRTKREVTQTTRDRSISRTTKCFTMQATLETTEELETSDMKDVTLH